MKENFPNLAKEIDIQVQEAQRVPKKLDTKRNMPRQKNVAQMKEQIKAPEKIQLSDKEIDNLSDAEFKTLVIRTLTEMVEYGHKIEKKSRLCKVK